MILTPEQKNELMEEMIKENSDTTVGDYYRRVAIKEKRTIVSSAPIPIPKRYYSTRRPKEPVLKDPSPFKRPLAEYGNRGHYQILEENL